LFDKTALEANTLYHYATDAVPYFY
jgi:hypothetical protein